MRRRRYNRRPDESSEFLWLVSLSDLMMLLFILFVMLFSIAHTQMQKMDFKRAVQAIRHEEAAPTPMDEAKVQMEKWAKTLAMQDKVEIKKTPDAVLLEVKDRVFFASGKYELHDQGRKILQSLVPILSGIPRPLKIGIEGHTDDVPVISNKVMDNWDLSARRAVSVLHALELPTEIQDRVVILAHGDKAPLLPNRDPQGQPLPENRNHNRRVTFRIF